GSSRSRGRKPRFVLAPIGGSFVGSGGAQDERLAEGWAHDLQPNRQAVRETAGHADGRHAGEIAGHRRAIGDQAWWHIQRPAGLEGATDGRRDKRDRRTDDNVDPLERLREILLNERAHLLAVQVLGGPNEQAATDALQDVW